MNHMIAKANCFVNLESFKQRDIQRNRESTHPFALKTSCERKHAY